MIDKICNDFKSISLCDSYQLQINKIIEMVKISNEIVLESVDRQFHLFYFNISEGLDYFIFKEIISTNVFLLSHLCSSMSNMEIQSKQLVESEVKETLRHLLVNGYIS